MNLTIVNPASQTGPPVTHQQKVKAWMQVFVSLGMLACGIAVLTAPNSLIPHHFDEGMKKIASGWIGTVVGYWLS